MANYPPRPPRPNQHHQQHRGQMGFPQLSPPTSTPPQYYPRGYQTVPGYVVDGGGPENSLPRCGLGVGWFLFIIGFFLGAIPWYIGVVILACSPIDYREKPQICCLLNWHIFFFPVFLFYFSSFMKVILH